MKKIVATRNSFSIINPLIKFDASSKFKSSVPLDSRDLDFLTRFLEKTPKNERDFWINNFLYLKQLPKTEHHIHFEAAIPTSYIIKFIRKHPDKIDWSWLAFRKFWALDQKSMNRRYRQLDNKNLNDDQYREKVKTFFLKSDEKKIEHLLTHPVESGIYNFLNTTSFGVCFALLSEGIPDKDAKMEFARESAAATLKALAQDGVKDIHFRVNVFFALGNQDFYKTLFTELAKEAKKLGVKVNIFICCWRTIAKQLLDPANPSTSISKFGKNILEFQNQDLSRKDSINYPVAHYPNQQVTSFFHKLLFQHIENLPQEAKSIIRGLDMVGNEEEATSQNLKDSKEIIAYLNKQLSNITNENTYVIAHAGEVSKEKVNLGLDMIEYSISQFNARRIGHGLALGFALQSKDPQIYNRALKIAQIIKKENIIVEVNLVSNYFTREIKLEQNPFRELIKHNVPISFSTDDPNSTGMRLSWELMEAMNVIQADRNNDMNSRNLLTLLQGEAIQ